MTSRSDLPDRKQSAEFLCWPIKGAICFYADGVLYEKTMSADEMEYLTLRLFVSMRETRHNE